MYSLRFVSISIQNIYPNNYNHIIIFFLYYTLAKQIFFNMKKYHNINILTNFFRDFAIIRIKNL